MVKHIAKLILCDIEGTTTAISFVKECLFPFSKQNVRQFLKTNWEKPLVSEIVNQLRNRPDYKGDNNIEDISKFVEQLINDDCKFGALKSLQGLIWEDGYLDGSIKSHVFEDVPVAFELWTKSGIKIYIYSSGSINAQKLLFKYSEKGNLLPYISGHFDTEIGNKKDEQSYKNILKSLQCSGSDILFFTDILEEAEAASNCSITSIILDRPGNADIPESYNKKFQIIKSFNEIEISSI